MEPIDKGTWVRISKKEALARFELAEPFYVCPNKMMPGCPFNMAIPILNAPDCIQPWRDGPVSWRFAFERMLREWAWHNASYETGYYAAFYAHIHEGEELQYLDHEHYYLPRAFLGVKVARVETSPPGRPHPIIRLDHTKVTAFLENYGLRVFGCRHAYITSQLRMVLVGVNPRDEVMRRWRKVPASLRINP